MEFNTKELDKEVSRILEEYRVKNNSLPLKHIVTTLPYMIKRDHFTLYTLLVRVTDREGFNHDLFKVSHIFSNINSTSSILEKVNSSFIKQLTLLLEKGKFDRSLETFKGWEYESRRNSRCYQSLS